MAYERARWRLSECSRIARFRAYDTGCPSWRSYASSPSCWWLQEQPRLPREPERADVREAETAPLQDQLRADGPAADILGTPDTCSTTCLGWRSGSTARQRTRAMHSADARQRGLQSETSSKSSLPQANCRMRSRWLMRSSREWCHCRTA